MPRKSLIPASWEVPPAIRQRVGEQVGRQRLVAEGDDLLLVLHAPPQADSVERQARFFWRKPDGAWLSNEYGGGAAGLLRHVQDFADRLAELDQQADVAEAIEQQLNVLARLSPIQRTARNLYAVLQEARQTRPEDLDLLNARDRAYELDRMAELLSADIHHQVQLSLARQSEEQTAAGHRLAVQSHWLNVLVAFFLPLATLASLFGMNLRHGMEGIDEPALFWGLSAAGLVLGLALSLWFARSVEER